MMIGSSTAQAIADSLHRMIGADMLIRGPMSQPKGLTGKNQRIAAAGAFAGPRGP